ncbi:MAG: Peptidoglycan D,D-transpeptidase MrdA [Chlamydiales bacterium]|nr:Peptidoglycan D,D-transpeptidase MrdA [Chlamydiales bacterium]MCH9636235.1 Peptidoglycan D,D-transpeptidase MrdA [Chlamydiales bacterium]
MVFLLLIVARIWHLSIVQHDEMLQEASRPQQKTVIEKPQRAQILDRNGVVLATNRAQYHASVCYTPIRQVRRVKTVIEDGKKVKKYIRRDYISDLSHKLGEILHLNPVEVEDAIYAKAAILGNVPYRLKENISESCYFQLKMLESSWPGIVAEIAPRREYPLGDVAGELIGYIGPISSSEYNSQMQKLQQLREEEEFEQLEEFQKSACLLNDLTGKMGAEASFDQQLRGQKGKSCYLADTRGNILRKLPGGDEPKEGSALNLTIDSRLQAYCEQLLVDYENEAPSMRPADIKRREKIPPLKPWIKGGAIVVMDPKSGELLAMASHPRFDPNDFVQKKKSINRILESEGALAEIWEFRQKLISESQSVEMTWENYLGSILPTSSIVVQQLKKFGSVKDALFVQEKLSELFALFDESPRHVIDVVYEDQKIGVQFTIAQRDHFANKMPEVIEQVRGIKSALAPYFDPIELNYEKLLLADLYRLLINPDLFVKQYDISLADYRLVSGHYFQVESALRNIIYDLFEQGPFAAWREEHFKSYLASMRKKERAEKQRYAKPYTDYLERKKRELFAELWEENRDQWLLLFLTGRGSAPFEEELQAWCNELAAGAHLALDWHRSYCQVKRMAHLPELFATFRSYNELEDDLWGWYPGLRSQTLKHLAAAFYPRYGFGTARSWAFRQATSIGSIFKLVPAYEAMRQTYLSHLEMGKSVADINPLTIIDDKHRVGRKGWNVGFTLDGKVIPHYYKGGRLPRTEHAGVGRVEVERALETSSNPYFAMLAGDIMDDPEDLVRAANLFSYGEKTLVSLPGEYAGHLPDDVVYDRTGLYSMAIGQHSLVGTPLQTAVMLSSLANSGQVLKPLISTDEEKAIRWELFLPKEIERKLVGGMRRVVMGEKGTARFVRRSFPDSLCERFVGKTSTAEIIQRYSLDGKNGTLKSKEIWFGGILYHDPDCKDPDVVIVVYLREGIFGRLAAPYAFKVAQFIESSRKSSDE